MRKDIEIPIAKDVYVAIAYEWNDAFLNKEYNAYIINNRDSAIEMVLVVSKGYDSDKKTSTMRHGIGLIDGKSSEKIEMLQEEVLALENEFFVTFYADNKLYERKYIFAKNSITLKNMVTIPILDKEGVIAS